MNPIGCVGLLSLENLSRTHNVKFQAGLRYFLTFWRTHDPVLAGLCSRNMHNIQSSKKTSLSKHTLCVKDTTSTGLVSNLQKEHLTVCYSSSVTEKTHSLSHLTKEQMKDLVLHLTAEERNDLQSALHEFQSKKAKTEYEGQLAGTRWRSTFGRPSKLPTLGDVDPTGTYCTVPDDWLAKKYAEAVPSPNTNELTTVVIHNAIPFVGFGFLDNFCMIVAGDYIEVTIGSMMVLSTMAAAALGNTISDVMGIGSAWYVERLAIRVGIQPPKLTPIQLDMPVSRRAANLGRVLGVTIGCLLGMFPLMFIGKKKEEVTLPQPTLDTNDE